MKLLLGCCLILLGVTGASAEETRGTLRQPIGRQVVIKADGEEQAFDVQEKTTFRVGTRQEEVDASHLREGMRVLVRHEGRRAVEVTEEVGWLQYPGQWLEDSLHELSDWSARADPDGYFSSYSRGMQLLSVGLVSLICGGASSLVVSNRMAFFGDALAHCAFAGVGLGLLLHSLEYLSGTEGILGIMVLFGVLVGVAIAYVRRQTSLASDTVIGVFFAFAMGFGAVLLQYVGRQTRFTPEEFVFGTPTAVSGHEFLFLILLLIAMVALLCRLYNRLVFASFNPSLARSRNFPVEFGNYAFIVLLALIVNICLKVVGALLINALLILPAATAGNLARNLRQFFWLSVVLSFLAGVGGLFVSERLNQGPGGMIVLAGVIAFFVSMPLGRFVRGRRALVRPGF